MRRKVSAYRNCEGNQYDLPYHKSLTTEQLNAKLKKGYMVLFEEGNPIHTVALLRDNKSGKIYRFSDGKKSVVTVEKENVRRCTNKTYRGVVIVK